MQKMLLCLTMVLTLILSGCSENKTTENNKQNEEVVTEVQEDDKTTKQNSTTSKAQTSETSKETESNNSSEETESENQTQQKETSENSSDNTTSKSTTTKNNKTKTTTTKETTKKDNTKKTTTESNNKDSNKTDTKNTTETKETTDTKKETVVEKKYVTLTISCSNILKHDNCLETNYNVPSNGVIYSQKVEISDGDSVLKILKNSGLRVDVSGGYVKGIDNLYEFDCGDESGWTYSVNGVKPNVGASQYKVKENDQIKWSYVVKRDEW
jgi:uncharacterized protein YceK